ncbi:hypothetical protein FJZ53_07170 [Candidatus Woesearchaeota archaeon]|nr:hypothetical protein [Candidatus Woesearchaeota archaeon]
MENPKDGKIEEKRKRVKDLFELSVFSLLLALLIAPGLFYTDIMAHELYHYAKNKEITEEICIDINKPYWGHVKVGFEDEQALLKYRSEEMNKEERNANIFGHIASAIYLINALIVVNWMLMLVVRKQRSR